MLLFPEQVSLCCTADEAFEETQTPCKFGVLLVYALVYDVVVSVGNILKGGDVLRRKSVFYQRVRCGCI